MAHQKGNDMVRWIGIGISLIVIAAGGITAFTIAGQKANAACEKADSTERRVTKLENEMAFFKGTVTVKLDVLKNDSDRHDKKLDELIRIMSAYERDQ